MELILDVKHGKYFLEKKNPNQRFKRSSTNDIDKIYSAINSLRYTAIRATYYEKDVRLYFGNHNYVVLKNYKKYQNSQLYQNVMEYIDEDTKIISNIKHINETKIKRMILTGALAISLAATVFNVVKSEGQEIEIEIEDPDLPDDNITEPIITPVPQTPSPTPKPTITSTPTPKPTITSTPTPKPTITIEPTIPLETFNESEYKTFDERLQDSLLMKSDSNISFSGIPLATSYSNYFLNRVNNFIETEGWEYYQKYGQDFGIDPYLGLAIGYTEAGLSHESTIPGGSNYNGHGVGIGQLEDPDGKTKVTAYNYETGQYETIVITMENACDLETNIKITMMLLQNKLYKYNNNIYATIQSYNYGDGAMKKILSAYAKEKNCEVEDILADSTDIGWSKYVKDLHENPKNYYPEWKYKTYGNDDYIKDVLGYYIGTETINTTSDGSKISIDLITMETTSDVKIVDKIK